MDGFDLFRRFFGIDRNFNGNSFKSPIWGDDEYEDDDEFDFGSHSPNERPTDGFGIRVFTGDPLDMHRAFERQFDELLNNFMGIMGMKSPLEFPELPSSPDAGGYLPPPEFGTESDDLPRSRYLKPSYEKSQPPNARKDTDLDGRITGRDIGDLFGQQEQAPALAPKTNISSQSSFTFSKTIRRPDGRIEHHKTFKLSDGSEHTTVTRELGGQSHSVTVKKNKDGTVEHNEDLRNMDEADLANFNRTWDHGSTGMGPQLPAGPSRSLISPQEDASSSWAYNWFRKWF